MSDLRKKAEACLHGDPWYTDENLLGRQNFGQFLPQDRSYIAAANPAAILALLDERDALREALTEIADDASPFDRTGEPLHVRVSKDLSRRVEIARQALHQHKGERP